MARLTEQKATLTATPTDLLKAAIREYKRTPPLGRNRGGKRSKK